MIQLILATVGFVPWVLYIIITYYSKNFSQIDHLESATGYGGYLLSIGVVYAIYKIVSIMMLPKTVKIGFWNILGWSLFHILIVSIAYTGAQNVTSSPFFMNGGLSSMVLFFQIIGFLIYPIFLTFLWRAIGNTILGFISGWKEIPLRIRIGGEISLGLAVFAFGLLGLGVFGLYTLSGLLILSGILTGLSFLGWKQTYLNIKEQYVEYPQHNIESENLTEIIQPRLITTEFAFIFVTFLISVSLINAIRPMPIGWDDLGVYMNYPRIMALTGYVLEGAGMYTWQLITGSGFLIHEIAANAFYINQLGGILSIIVITCILSYLLERNGRLFFIGLPLLLASIYYMMPMTVFQQAKDMKLDPALMMVSVSAFGVLWYALKQKIQSNTLFLTLIGLAGLLTGIAFGIKITTLMLVLGFIGLIAYNLLGISGFLGFFFVFIAVFTGGNLWGKMNIWMPVDNTSLIHTIAITSMVLGCISLLLGYVGKEYGFPSFKKLIYTSMIFLGGVTIALLPWFIKNGMEIKLFTNEQIGKIDGILGGYGGTMDLQNYSAIYTKEEFETRKENQKSASITNDGKSLNEDFSRYFGQESGINNYLKLPANITFQKNQAGEFTEITYIFLAFLPSIFLFLRGRKYKNISWTRWIPFIVTLFGILMMSLYYFHDKSGDFLTEIFGNIVLPHGYGYMLAGVLLFVLIGHYTIDTDEDSHSIKDFIILLSVYGFLFLISAFGIVWYGIFVYFIFLVLIGLASLSFVSYTSNESADTLNVKGMIAFIFFVFIFAYILRSAFPHGWNNLVQAGMNEYKYGKLEQNESIFTYRSDYITSIATMNNNNPSAVVKRAGSLATTSFLKNILTPERLENLSVSDLHQILLQIKIALISGKQKIENKQALEADLANITRELTSSILHPKNEELNKKGIYRIGTFMTYLISENRKRYLEDSLVFEFETYFYDPIPEKAIERMRSMGLGYLLTDLNAATIDRDPRHVLTKRFEHLLLTMRAKNITLVDTDNLCLRVAIDEFHSGKLQSEEEFIDIAGTNYESYRGNDMKIVSRGEKQNKCANYIVNSINNSVKNNTELPIYLVELQKSLQNAKTQAEQQNILSRAVGQSYFALFEILE